MGILSRLQHLGVVANVVGWGTIVVGGRRENADRLLILKLVLMKKTNGYVFELKLIFHELLWFHGG